MRLGDDERARLLRRLDGATADAIVAANIIETFGNQTRAKDLGYVLETHEHAFQVRLTSGFDVVSSAHVRAIVSASARITAVRLNCATRSIDVDVTRGEPTTSAYVARATRVARHVDIEYDAASVPDKADCATIDALVDDVYNSLARIPATMSVWYERIRGGVGDSASESTIVVDDDASESVGAAVVGYTLCFEHMPVVTLDFLEYLTTKHAAAIAAAYVWFTPDANVAATPLFVINIRCASTPLASTKRIVANALPRGRLLPPQQPSAKRARVAT